MLSTEIAALRAQEDYLSCSAVVGEHLQIVARELRAARPAGHAPARAAAVTAADMMNCPSGKATVLENDPPKLFCWNAGLIP